MFELRGKKYLVVVDYYSLYLEVCHLRETATDTVIALFKSLFARHGIPETFRSDNGPQFTSGKFVNLTKEYQIKHVKSSPHYPKSNGEAERIVKIAKDIFKKAEDPSLVHSCTGRVLNVVDKVQCSF